MKIGFLNPWRDAAENQIFQSLAIAAPRIGHELVHCANSMEVAAQAPDFVLACSPVQAKLNDIPHYAVIHAPRYLYLVNRGIYGSTLSCDGYLTIADTLARFVRDLTFAAGRPQEAGFFFFSPQRIDTHADLRALCAVGIVRHLNEIGEAGRIPMPQSWTLTVTAGLPSRRSSRPRITRSFDAISTSAIASMPFTTRLSSTCWSWTWSASTGGRPGSRSHSTLTP